MVQVARDKFNNFWTEDGRILRTHMANYDCFENGCLIHHPTFNHMSNWPLNWREDRAMMERTCKHGLGHPDIDSASFHTRTGKQFLNIHSCDGCCHPPAPIDGGEYYQCKPKSIEE